MSNRPAAATARFADELDELRAGGADVAYHVLAESGPGFVRQSLAVLGAPELREAG